MRCSQARRLFIDFCEGELSDDVLKRFKSHLDACPRCQQQLRSLQRTMAVLREVEPAPAPPGFWEHYLVEVRSKIDAKNRARWLSRLVPSLGAAAAVILLVFLLLTGRQKEQNPLSVSWSPEQESIGYVAYMGASVAESVDVVQVLGEKLLSSDEIASMESLYCPSEQMAEQITQIAEEMRLAYEAYYNLQKGGE